MKFAWLKFVSISSLLFCSFAWAESAQDANEQADIGSWSFGINIGFGQRSTFITGQDDVDIFVLPDIHYYGEQFFFDNGTLGYTLAESENHVFSVITELNPYGLYFEQSAFGESFNSLYLFDQAGTSVSESFTDDSQLVTSAPDDDTTNNNAFDQESRSTSYNWPRPDLSLDFGIQHNWFISATQDITVKLARDISGEHSGFRGKFTWSLKHQLPSVKLRLNLGFDWLDNKSSNYYFGLSPTPLELQDNQYELGSSINPFVSITASTPITKHLSLISHLKYLKFDSSIADSPVTNGKHAVTYFAGIHYKFW